MCDVAWKMLCERIDRDCDTQRLALIIGAAMGAEGAPEFPDPEQMRSDLRDALRVPFRPRTKEEIEKAELLEALGVRRR